MRRQADITADERLLRAADKMEARERAIWRQADLSLYPSEEEADIAYALAPDCRFASVIPYGFDRFPTPRDAPDCQEIVFVAGFGHPPNEDAACWFVSEVLPLVKQKVPTAYLSIVGSNPTSRVRALARDGVSVRADVSDTELRAAYTSARVAVVPLRVGAGVKRKVVEALSEGLPLVTTPVGAQGLPGLLRVASIEADPTAFALAVVRLLTDDSSWGWQSSAQLAFATQRFSHAAMAASLMSALNSVTARAQFRAA
jgi:glycosyltransferase involved in cell wall biosynthesis